MITTSKMNIKHIGIRLKRRSKIMNDLIIGNAIALVAAILMVYSGILREQKMGRRFLSSKKYGII